MNIVWCWLLKYGDAIFQIGLMIVSILIVLWLESLKRPKLRIEIGDVAHLPANDPSRRPETKWTHVHVFNETMPWFISWVWDRDPALACRGFLIFYDKNGKVLFNGKKMEMRWSNNPEPLEMDPATGQIKGIDWDKMRIGHVYDIPAYSKSFGEHGSLAVVNRINGEAECYGWNNNSYLHNWRNPDWRLEAGKYFGKIIIISGGRLYTETVAILNAGTFEDFFMEISDIKL